MTRKTKTTKYLFACGILILLSFATYDSLFSSEGFTQDTAVFGIVLVFMYVFFEKLNLSNWLFALLILILPLHLAGTFGFYGTSPLIVPWDYVTHFVPMVVIAMGFFSMLHVYMSKQIDVKTTFLIIIAILATMGVGALVENLEFYGYLQQGFGGGAFAFGEGDAFPGQEISDSIETYVGGWFNTMWDLVNNFLGALLGTTIMTLKTFVFKTEEKTAIAKDRAWKRVRVVFRGK